MARWLALLLALAFPAAAGAALENDALALAVADVHTLDFHDRPFIRYILVTTAEVEDLKCVSIALNYFNRNAIPVRPIPLGAGPLMLLRIDLRDYASREVNLRDFVKTWEQLQFDPKFSLLITRGTLKFVADKSSLPPVRKTTTLRERVLVDCEPYVQDGKTFKQKWSTKETVKTTEVPFKDADVQLLRLPSEHLDQFAVGYLSEQLHTAAPVVTHSYFIARSLSTIKRGIADKEDGLFAAIYGGLYYEFAGIKSGAKKGTDLDVLLESLGIGNVQAGVTFAEVFEKIRSDQRAAIFRSDVTGKPRRVIVLNTLLGRESKGIVVITQDFADEDIDIDTDVTANLLDLKSKAQEVIWELIDGQHGFAIFDGNGKLVDEVPGNIAHDTTIPRPFPQRLQPAIGCIRCHAVEGGWRIVGNDVKRMVGQRTDLNIFDDRQGKAGARDNVKRLAGLYAGNLELRLLPRARDDYASAILRSAGPWPKSPDQTDIHKLSGERLGLIYKRYVYDSIDARKALRELSVPCGADENAAEKFASVTGAGTLNIDGFRAEDPRIAALKEGLSINRSQFDLAYSFMATRIQRNKK